MEAESSEASQGQLYTGISDGPLILTFVLSVVTFGLINMTLSWLLPGVITLGQSTQRRFRNIAVSFAHASLSAPLCFYCYYFAHEGKLSTLRDMVLSGSDAAYVVVTISVGYFFYDFLDNWLQGKLVSSWEITIHHIVSIACMGYTAATRSSIWFAIMILMVETNSFFLHLRKMLQMAGVPAYSRTYTVVKVLNLITFVVFRGIALVFVVAGLITVYPIGPTSAVVLASFILVFMLISVPIFFWRLIKSDFLNSASRKKREEGATSEANGDCGMTAASSVSEQTRKGKMDGISYKFKVG